MKHRILVTGGMGYVGGRVAQSLTSRSDVEIILGSRKVQASPSWLPTAQVVAMEWSSNESLRLACDGIEILVHLAGMNDSDCLRDPVAALEANTVNTTRLMEAVKVVGIKRVIYFSTAHIYGPSLVGQIDESTLPKSRHPYATSHRAAEDVVLATANANIDSIVLRLSNGFGVPTHPEVNAWMLLMNDLCRQAVTLRSMTLRSTGLQRRDFVTLHDVARVVDHMIDLPKSEVLDGVFNVGSGKSARVIDMVELIQARCNKVLGFTPKINLSQSISNEVTLPFDFKIDKLIASGFKLSNNILVELDATLLFCNNVFGATQ